MKYSSLWSFQLVSSFSILCVLVFNDDINRSVQSALLPDLKPAEIGGCYDIIDNILVFCAAVAEECEGINGTSRVRFKTKTELEYLTPSSSWCSTDTLPVGTCQTTGQCAITKDSCDTGASDPNEFVSSHHNLYTGTTSMCNAHGRFVNGRYQPTQYGGCKNLMSNELTCVLTPDDCLTSERWVSANEATKVKQNGCRCHDVHIGVCKGSDGRSTNDDMTCAISNDDCGIMQSFENSRHVIEDLALLDCRLCPYDAALTASGGKTDNVRKQQAGKDYGGHGGHIFFTMLAIVVSVVGFALCLRMYMRYATGKEAVDESNSNDSVTTANASDPSSKDDATKSAEELPNIS